MTKQIAQFLWVGPGLSPLESVCLKSFLDVGYEVHLYAYDALDAVPDGVVIMDAGEILPSDDVFLGAGARGGSYAPFADRFRYNLLFQRGGWWFDTDHIALKVLPEPTDLYVATQWEGELGEYACVGAIWCTPGDPRLGWLKDRAAQILEGGTALEYTRLGPMLMNEMVEHFGVQHRLAPWWEFNAYPYYHLDRLVFRTNRAWLIDKLRFARHLMRQVTDKHFRAAYIRPGSRAVHLSNEIWRARGLDKGLLYHPRSPYGRMQRRHGFVPRPSASPVG